MIKEKATIKPKSEPEQPAPVMHDDIMKPSIDIPGLDSSSGIIIDSEIDSEIGKAESVKDEGELDKIKETKSKLEKDIIDREVAGLVKSDDIKDKDVSKILGGDSDLENLKKFNIEWGGAYIITSKNPEFGINIFKNFSLKNAETTLSFTRTHPSKLNLDIPEDNITHIWLSKSSEKDSISPGNITKIAHMINEFLKTNDKGVILLDGLEYLITNNDFPMILKFIESIHERVVLNNGILFVPINPAALSKNNLELLENELSNTIQDSIIQVKDKDTELEKEPKTGKGPEPKPGAEVKPQDDRPKVRSASKKDLQALCKKLGLKTDGTLDDLKLRLLEFDEGKTTGVDKDLKSSVDGIKSPQAKPELPKEITDHEKKIMEELAGEREKLEKLLSERKKLQDDIAKLKKEEQKHQMELKKRKLLVEQQNLKEEKKKLEAERKRLQQLLQKSKSSDKSIGEILREADLGGKTKKPLKAPQTKRTKPSLPPTAPITKKSKQVERIKGKPMLRPEPKRQIKEMSSKQLIKPIKRKPTKIQAPIADKSDDKYNKGILLVKSNLKSRSVEEFAVKQLKKSILGKPIEVIQNIRPVYLPLLRIYVKAMRGTLFAKEHGGIFYFDTVTGEVITDVSKVLKRSKGLSMLMSLSQNQAKVLAAMDTWGSNDIVDIQNNINIPANEIKRALTALRKKSLVSVEQQPDKRIDNYKRMIELKIPKKFEKIKVEMPQIIKGALKNEIIVSNYRITELEKLIYNIFPGTRIVKIEEIYYPYFHLLIVGKSGPRDILLDAVTGSQDKTLTEFIQYHDG
jgi:hypothetical protein